MNALRHRNAALEQESPDFVNGCGPFRHEAGPHAMQRLQIELFFRFGGHEPHGWPLHGFRRGLGVAVIVLVPFQEGLHILGRH